MDVRALGRKVAQGRVRGRQLVRRAELGLRYGELILERTLQHVQADTVLDIGANAGQYGRQLRQALDFRGTIISFEPIPEVAEQLREQVRADPRWHVHAVAVDERPGTATFHVMAGSQFSSLLTPAAEFEGRFGGKAAVSRTVEVPVITLSDAARMAGDCSHTLLKLDTQGTELRILRGGAQVLAQFPAIQLELGLHQLYQGESGYREVIDALDGWGFALAGLFPNNLGHFPHLLESDAVFLRADLLPELT